MRNNKQRESGQNREGQGEGEERARKEEREGQRREAYQNLSLQLQSTVHGQLHPLLLSRTHTGEHNVRASVYTHM